MLSQHFHANQGHSDLRKIAVFRWAFATEYNELKKNILNNACKVIELGLCQKLCRCKTTEWFFKLPNNLFFYRNNGLKWVKLWMPFRKNKTLLKFQILGFPFLCQEQLAYHNTSAAAEVTSNSIKYCYSNFCLSLSKSDF